jgi:type VI secretion system protein ImpA
MPDTSTDAYVLPPAVDLWLLPLGDGQGCGPNLEYDPESLELEQATGKPESQFGPGEPPDWGRVRDLAESLLARTRDLRFALWWGRAKVNLDGFSAVPAALALLVGLLENFWDDLHPVPDPDETDALARLSVIGALNKTDSLLGDIRAARLSDDRQLLGLRVRDVEVALGKLARRSDEAQRTQAEIAGMLAQTTDTAAALRVQADAALTSLARIQALMVERFSPDLVVDLAAVRGMLAGIKTVLPASAVIAELVSDGTQSTAASEAIQAPSRQGGGVHSIETRQDAIRAIELVCAYLERSEPTNPAQMLLRRAARVINKDFLQLVRELAPDAVADVARIMGVDPDAVNDQN